MPYSSEIIGKSHVIHMRIKYVFKIYIYIYQSTVAQLGFIFGGGLYIIIFVKINKNVQCTYHLTFKKHFGGGGYNSQTTCMITMRAIGVKNTRHRFSF